MPPGGSVTVSGTGFAANARIELTLRSDPIFLGSVRADQTGSFQATVQIPSSVSPGPHRIVAIGASADGGTLTLTTTVTVTGDALAGTGRDVALITLLVLGLAVVGTIAVVRSRA